MTGQALGKDIITHLNPVHIFKGKFIAVAKRTKFQDLVDLRWLEARNNTLFHKRRTELDLEFVNLVIKRYPELELIFTRIGVDINVVRFRVTSLDLSRLPPTQKGDIQRDLFARS